MNTEEYEVISQKEAKERGLKYYFTKRPCKYGSFIRRTSDRHCICDECLKKVSERVREYNRLNRKERAEYSKRYNTENRKDRLEKWRAYRAKNREKVSKRERIYQQNNPDKVNAKMAKRRAAKRQAVPAWFGEFDQLVFEEAYSLAALREAETGFEWHVDHIVPLQAKKACGLHCADNIQVIPAEMNLSKNNKMVLTKPLEWLRVWTKAHNVSMRPKTASKEESCARPAP